ncbi:YpzG family protein [Halobacillus sp. A5]|nr:YpzG family protein [Halobacillus sp. A5]MCP3028849.1 YpzG family protein [Halobacillus sp. A5]
MGKRNNTQKSLHRGAKHLNHRVNGETEQTQSEQIIETQMRKKR